MVCLLNVCEHIYWTLDLEGEVHSIRDLWRSGIQECKIHELFSSYVPQHFLIVVTSRISRSLLHPLCDIWRWHLFNICSRMKTSHKSKFEYIWTNHMSNVNNGCPLERKKTSNDNIKNNNKTTTTLNICIPCSPNTIFV